MYYNDYQDDKVEVIPDFPQSSVGSPCPIILRDEHTLVVCFYIQNTLEDSGVSDARIIGSNNGGEPTAIVRFNRTYACASGPPNDEGISRHPLASHGLSAEL